MTFYRSAWTELREGGLFHSERSWTMFFFTISHLIFLQTLAPFSSSHPTYSRVH